MGLIDHIRVWLPFLAATLFVALYEIMPDSETVTTHEAFLCVLAAVVIVFGVLAVLSYPFAGIRRRMVYRGPFLCGLVLLLALHEIATLKTAVAPLPFFPSLTKVIEAYIVDGMLILKSIGSSLGLLAWGFATGVILGFVNGLVLGLFRKIDYWINPIFRFIGPIPAAALVPMAIIIAPTSYAASVFLVAYSVWYPVAVQTWSGVSSVDKAYFDVARTLGGGRLYELRHIVVPAIMPSVFYGIYMGFCYSFATLIIAEMMGASSGLGYYINWAMGWGSYYKLYAALIIVATMCSSLIWGLFKVRGHVLRWRKEGASA